MVVALQNRLGPVSEDELRQIAAIQQTISAFEDVIADLDCETSDASEGSFGRPIHSFPPFGRRGPVHGRA